jgi:hypothetical protein
MKKVDVIVAACEELGISYENNALWFEILIDQAIATFNTATKFDIFVKALEVNDKRAMLPNNFAKLRKITSGACSTGCAQGCYFEGVDYMIQGRYIIFSSCLDIIDGSDITIDYMGLALDEHGEVFIPEKWERMLVAYLCWKYSRKHHQDYPAYIIQDYKREFANQKASNG